MEKLNSKFIIAFIIIVLSMIFLFLATKEDHMIDDDTDQYEKKEVTHTVEKQRVTEPIVNKSIQEKYAKAKGFTKLRTKSMNQFKPMMILNLKNGFDISKVYTNAKGQTKRKRTL